MCVNSVWVLSQQQTSDQINAIKIVTMCHLAFWSRKKKYIENY